MSCTIWIRKNFFTFSIYQILKCPCFLKEFNPTNKLKYYHLCMCAWKQSGAQLFLKLIRSFATYKKMQLNCQCSFYSWQRAFATYCANNYHVHPAAARKAGQLILHFWKNLLLCCSIIATLAIILGASRQDYRVAIEKKILNMFALSLSAHVRSAKHHVRAWVEGPMDFCPPSEEKILTAPMQSLILVLLFSF